MKEKNQTNEQNNNQNKPPKIFLALKIVAGILIVLGIVLFIMSFTIGDSFEAKASSMGLRFGGIVCFIFGLFFMFIGFTPNIQKTMIKTQKHILNENKEDLKDIADTSADVSKDAVKTVAGAVKDGLTEEKMFCKHCGKEIDKDSKFCQYCGKEQ